MGCVGRGTHLSAVGEDALDLPPMPKIKAVFRLRHSIVATVTVVGLPYCSAEAVKKIKKMPMEMALANGAAYFVILVLLTAVVFGGRYQGMGVTFLCVGIGSVIAGISAGKGRRKAKRKATKKWHG